MVVALLTV